MAKNSISFAKLDAPPKIFDPVSANVAVFYDDSTKQIVVVRSNGAGGIIVNEQTGLTTVFRVEDRGEIEAVRFSPNKSIAAVQRAPNALDFINFGEGRDSTPYCQTCKGKTSRINDFFWVSNSEILFVTDMSLELYEINPDKKILRCVKVVSIGTIHWSIWHTESRTLIISTGAYGNHVCPFLCERGSIAKLNKVEVDLAFFPAEPKVTLLKRDVVLSKIYGQMYVIVLKWDQRASQMAELSLFNLPKDGKTPYKTHSLKLNTNGQFQMNVIDNLILVHHLQSKSSLLFDIKFPSIIEGDLKIVQQPLVSPLPLKMFDMTPSFGGASQPQLELFAPTWIVFQPDIVVDAVKGYMWKVKLCLESFPLMIGDKTLLVEFLLLRTGAKQIIMSTLKEMLFPTSTSPLRKIGDVFDRINQVYAHHEQKMTDYEIIGAFENDLTQHAINVIQQSDMYREVFCPLFNEDTYTFQKPSFPSSVLVEYITSIQRYGLRPETYIYELLVNILVRSGDLYKLHQFLQYHVMADSKPLACLLLSIQQVYPAAYQIALDMFKRLEAHEEIVEVFLSRHQVMSAIRYLRSVGMADNLKPRKYLQCAKDSGNPDLFYNTYKFFEDMNVRFRKTIHFSPAEHCDEFVEYFNTLFEVGG